MLRSYWCLGLALVLVASPVDAQSDSNRSAAEESAAQGNAQDSDIPAPEVAAAIDRLVSELEKGRVDQTDPYAEERNERERRDIIAQEGMADWAFPMFLAVLAQTLLALGALTALVLDLRQNRRSAETQLRAYVSAKPIALATYGKSGRVEAELEIKNDGDTPAYNLRQGGNFLVATEEEAERELSVGERPQLGKPRPFTLQIGQTMNAGVVKVTELKGTEKQALRKGKKQLWLFGFVSYEDAFGSDRKLRYCYQADGAIMPAVPPREDGPIINDIHWVLAPFHNDSD